MLATHFLISGLPATITAGTQEPFTIQALNADGATDTAYSGTVHFSSSDGKAQLPADTTLTNGAGSFAVTLKTTGSRTLTASDTVDPTITSTFSVNQSVPVYSQPADASGAIYKSSWYPPDGLDGDQYTYDNFTLSTAQSISGLTWRGGYSNYLQGAGKSPVYDFTIKILGTVAGFQPDIINPPLAQYHVGGNAGETFAGTFGGRALYDYSYTLPTPFAASANTKYWVQIEASQGLTPTYSWPPDWGLASATGGDGSHFTFVTGGIQGFFSSSGDLAFTLLTSQTASSVLVNPAAASQLTINGFPSTTTAGTAGTVTVTAQDSFGNVATNYNGTLHFTSTDGKGTLPADTSLSSGTGTFSVTLNSAGNQSITVTDTVTPTLTASQTNLVVTASQLSLSPSTLPNAVYGATYPAQTLTASGGTAPYSYLVTAGALPNGLSLGNDGKISGAPTASGAFSFTVQATDKNGLTGSQRYSLEVDQAPAFTSSDRATFTVGAVGSFLVQASGFPVPTLSDNKTDLLPGGVTFDPATGLLKGTPVAGSGGTYILHLTAHNGIGTDATQTFTLTVNEAPTITSADHATFVTGQLNSFKVTTGSQLFPKQVTLTETDNLPNGSGVTFHDNGDGTATISGTPGAAAVGSYTLTITASNGVGAGTTQTFTLVLQNPSPSGGPSVLSVQRYGAGWQPTLIVLRFSDPVDPTSAQDLANYRLTLTGSKRALQIASATYDPNAHTVTLRPVKLLPLKYCYTLTVRGTPPNGVTDTQGRYLAGAGQDHPGTNYTTTINRRNSYLGSPSVALVSSRVALPAGPRSGRRG